MQRFYYKSKDGKGFLNLKSAITDENYIQITKEEFEELTKPKVYEPTAEQKAAQEKAEKIEFQQRLFRKLQRFSDENGGLDIDWSNLFRFKYFIKYNHDTENIWVDCKSKAQDFGQVYFISEEVVKYINDVIQ